MAPVPDNGDDSFLYSNLNPNSLFEDAMLTDSEPRYEEILEISREISLDTSISPISFEGSCWNESQDSNIVNYVPENLIIELNNDQEVSVSGIEPNQLNIPTIHQDHTYSQNPSEYADNDIINKDEEIENLNFEDGIENINVDEIVDIDTSEIDVTDDNSRRSMAENVLVTVNAEIVNRPRRGRPRRRNYAEMNMSESENRENNGGKRRKGKKRMDDRTRALHNTKERDRRHALKRDIAFLAEQIPNLPNKKPMNLVLQKAIEYIKKLEAENDKCEKELKTAKKLNEDLSKRFARLQHETRRK
ncbi:transcriptional regulator CBF1-like [Centruroides sculpturatus]|uniref:transcriptional regulator CBF1-like n=2 Tax=Centruroides sculpturatus TaxID=218467 RepID=UPI000C6EB629|nr:transcriptional regulator CBF1-like [Centruroides sculpturatus]XP_023212626.1 transcriptional regulator CBF1-like [Centruroides sculpturatus]